MEITETCDAPEPPEGRDIAARLRRLEGQVRGLQTMLSQGRDCEAVVTQFLAVRAALDEVGARIVDLEVSECLSHQQPDRQRLGRLVRLWLRLSH